MLTPGGSPIPGFALLKTRTTAVGVEVAELVHKHQEFSQYLVDLPAQLSRGRASIHSSFQAAHEALNASETAAMLAFEFNAKLVLKQVTMSVDALKVLKEQAAACSAAGIIASHEEHCHVFEKDTVFHQVFLDDVCTKLVDNCWFIGRSCESADVTVPITSWTRRLEALSNADMYVGNARAKCQSVLRELESRAWEKSTGCYPSCSSRRELVTDMLTALALVNGHWVGKHAGLAISPDGLLVVHSNPSKNYIVVRHLPHGEFLGVWGKKGSGYGQFNKPCRICFSPGSCDTVLVADANNKRVQEIRVRDGTSVRCIGTGLFKTQVYSVDVSPTGIMVAGERSTIHVFKYSSGERTECISTGQPWHIPMLRIASFDDNTLVYFNPVSKTAELLINFACGSRFVKTFSSDDRLNGMTDMIYVGENRANAMLMHSFRNNSRAIAFWKRYIFVLEVNGKIKVYK